MLQEMDWSKLDQITKKYEVKRDLSKEIYSSSPQYLIKLTSQDNTSSKKNQFQSKRIKRLKLSERMFHISDFRKNESARPLKQKNGKLIEQKFRKFQKPFQFF